MQIVIDIPEEEYRCVKLTGHIGNCTQVSNAIYNGTPISEEYDEPAIIKITDNSVPIILEENKIYQFKGTIE